MVFLTQDVLEVAIRIAKAHLVPRGSHQTARVGRIARASHAKFQILDASNVGRALQLFPCSDRALAFSESSPYRRLSGPVILPGS
jgi:hypothetical protein